MQIFSFFNPLASDDNRFIIISAATSVEALNVYMDRFFPNCRGINLAEEFSRDDVIVMSLGVGKDVDGVWIFSPMFAIKFN